MMNLKLLGTGAADYDWKKYGEPGVRGSTSSLLDGRILIDCGATGYAALVRFAIPLERIDTLLVTHSHDDHFDPRQIALLAAGRSGEAPLAVYASPEALAMLPTDLVVEPHPITPGMTFAVHGVRVTVLPANHLTCSPDEDAFHFALESDTGNLLYALDGAAMFKQAFQLISKMRFDVIVCDCTMADAGDWRIFEHSDIDMVAHWMKTLRNQGVADEKTRVVLDHFAQTLWPENEAERQAKIAGTGFELGFDGMEIALR